MTHAFTFRSRGDLASFAIMLVVCAAVGIALGACKSGEYALVAAQHNAQLTSARNAEFRDFVLAVDARQRTSLERELDLIWQVGEAAIEAKFARDLADASAVVAPASGAGSPSAGDSRPSGQLDDGAPALRMVEVGTVARLVAQQNADRTATRAAVAAKRREITAQLDRELRAWLDDPKGRQQDRIAAAMEVYARQESEFARFLQDTGAQIGVSIPGATK